MIQLQEGWWAVTRSGEKRGPMHKINDWPGSPERWTDDGKPLAEYWYPAWRGDGTFFPGKQSDHDIIGTALLEAVIVAHIRANTWKKIFHTHSDFRAPAEPPR